MLLKGEKQRERFSGKAMKNSDVFQRPTPNYGIHLRTESVYFISDERRPIGKLYSRFYYSTIFQQIICYNYNLQFKAAVSRQPDGRSASTQRSFWAVLLKIQKKKVLNFKLVSEASSPLPQSAIVCLFRSLKFERKRCPAFTRCPGLCTLRRQALGVCILELFVNNKNVLNIYIQNESALKASSYSLEWSNSLEPLKSTFY